MSACAPGPTLQRASGSERLSCHMSKSVCHSAARCRACLHRARPVSCSALTSFGTIILSIYRSRNSATFPFGHYHLVYPLIQGHIYSREKETQVILQRQTNKFTKNALQSHMCSAFTQTYLSTAARACAGQSLCRVACCSACLRRAKGLRAGDSHFRPVTTTKDEVARTTGPSGAFSPTSPPHNPLPYRGTLKVGLSQSRTLKIAL